MTSNQPRGCCVVHMAHLERWERSKCYETELCKWTIPWRVCVSLCGYECENVCVWKWENTFNTLPPLHVFVCAYVLLYLLVYPQPNPHPVIRHLKRTFPIDYSLMSTCFTLQVWGRQVMSVLGGGIVKHTEPQRLLNDFRLRLKLFPHILNQ